MKTPIALFLLIASVLPVSDAIAKKPKFDPQQLVDQIKESTPKNQYLMAEPTDDPSPWIGRFIPDNVAGPDESAAQKTRCSEFLQRNIVTKSAFGTMETTMSAMTIRMRM